MVTAGDARADAVIRDDAAELLAAGPSLALLDALYASAPVGLAFVDRELQVRRVNQQWTKLSSRSPTSHIGGSLVSSLGELGERIAGLCESALTEEQPVTDVEVTRSPAVPRDGARDWLVSCAPVKLDGHVLGVSLAVQDITSRKRAERRASFLAHVSEILDFSLDYRQTLERVARLAVADFADWCSISMLDDRGRMYRLAVAHADPELDGLAQELIEREALPQDAPAGAASVMRTTTTQVVDDFSDELLAESLNDPRSLEIVRTLGLASSVSVPLIARGRTLGAISLLSVSKARFGPEDVQLAEDLARRAAVSIDNARLYTEYSRIAHTLQAGLLPPQLPAIPGLQLAARYRPAGELNEVGGDFYDVYLRSAGEWLVVIGDVTGKGAEAAATTALIRYTLRAAALRPGSASDLLRQLNQAMVTQGASFCTVALISIRASTASRAELSVCLAGHPAPILLRAGGDASPVGAYGTLLGWVRDPQFTEVGIDLQPGDTLVLHTDGLTEATPPGWTEEELCRRLQDSPAEDLHKLLAHLEDLAVAAADGHVRDDIALLALRALGATSRAGASSL